MLASMAVLAVVLVLASQILSQASQSSERESKRLTSFSGAIGAFDRLATDLAMRVRGANSLVVTNDGKTLSFFAQVRNSNAGSRISQVTYFAKEGKLFRQVEPVDWLHSPTTPTPATDGDILSDEVFGLQFSFLRRDGGIYPDTGAKPEENAALVATFACLDKRSRARFQTSDTVLETLNTSHLKGVSVGGSTQTPLHVWNAETLSQQTSELETTIRNHAYFYERLYPLD